MNLEDSNNEIYQFKSYEINIKNPVALNKKSEKEKKIKVLDFNNNKSKKEENLPEGKNQPIYNYPYEFYEESESKKDQILNKNQKQASKQEISKISNKKEEKKESSKVEVVKNKPEKKEEKQKINEVKKEEKLIEKINNRESRKQLIKNEIRTEENNSKEQKRLKNNKMKNDPKKDKKKIEKVKKEEIKSKEVKKEEIKTKEAKNEEKRMEKTNPKEQILIEKVKENMKNENKMNEQKMEQNKIEEQIIAENKELPKIEEQPIDNLKKEEEKMHKLTLEKVDYKGLENTNPQEQNSSPPQIKEKKDSYKISEKTTTDQLPKTLLTKKTEDNYDLMMKYFKEQNYKRGDDAIIEELINYKDFSNDKFIGLVSDKIKIDNNNKEIIDDFLQRIKDDTKLRQENNKTANDSMKLIDDSTKKKLFFDSKQSQQEFFDSFYNKQIQYQNNCKEHINKLINKYDEERKKNYMPEPKNKNNLNYFKKNEPVKISKYSFKAQNSNAMHNKSNNNNEEIIEEKSNKKEFKNRNIKNLQSFGPNSKVNNKSHKNINTSNNNYNNIINNNTKEKKENKHLKKVKSGPLLTRNERKLTKKELEEKTNILHYDGELSKIK